MKNDIQAALEVLNSGGVILYPTDTVWGLGCDATNPEAVAKIFKIKERDDAKALLVLADTLTRVRIYVDTVPDIVYSLSELATTPMTVIYDKGRNLAPNLLAPDGSIGIRVTSDPFCVQLITRFKRPIVSTSANISGAPTPKNFSEISKDLIERVDYCVEHRQNDRKEYAPSSIIKISNNGVFKIIR